MSRFIIFQTNAEYYSAPWEIAKRNKKIGGIIMSQIFIYQTDADYAFLPWRKAKTKFSLDDYKKVYAYVLFDEICYKDKSEKVNEDNEIVLDKLFIQFNQHKPDNYRARSLSMSDVVAIQRKNSTKWYYCDSYGWKLIKELNEFTEMEER